MTLPRPRARKPAGNISAFDAEPVLQHDLRPKITRERTAARFSSARLPDLVFPLDEDRQQFLLNVAAAVPPLVDHESILIPAFADLFLETPKRRLIHRLDMEISYSSAREPSTFLRFSRTHRSYRSWLKAPCVIVSIRATHEPSSVGLLLNVTSAFRLSRLFSIAQ